MIDAQTAYARARRRGRRERVVARLLRRPRASTCLPSLEQALGVAPPPTGVVGLRVIPVDSIVGTVEPTKARAFDRSFRPPRSSGSCWERIWVATRRGAALPPISVVRLGEHYYVSDGHHRVSVARPRHKCDRRRSHLPRATWSVAPNHSGSRRSTGWLVRAPPGRPRCQKQVTRGRSIVLRSVRSSCDDPFRDRWPEC
jgi:hypothetical protein